MHDYALITAVWNGDEHIRDTIDSVASQTIHPVKWVIVSDGSDDDTDRIVLDCAATHPFIQFVRRERDPLSAGFCSKVAALTLCYEQLRGAGFDFICILDGDVTFRPDYFESLLDRFVSRPRLGLAGGYVCEPVNGVFRSRVGNNPRSVAGAVQMFRRECYEGIGGHRPLENGGEDWLAEIMARMQGWDVRAFVDLPVYHHSLPTSRKILHRAVREGFMDYSLGTHPLFAAVKCLRRLSQKPYFAYSAFRMAGFCWISLLGRKRPVPPEVVDFLRREQMNRLRSIVSERSRRWNSRSAEGDTD